MAKQSLAREQFAAMPLRVLHWGEPPDGTTVGAWYLATRREILSVLKLAAVLRRRIQTEPNPRRKRDLDNAFSDDLREFRQQIAFHKSMTWCGDQMVFSWSWRLAVPKVAVAAQEIYGLAGRMCVTWPPEDASEPVAVEVAG